jgi:hypothetical protein
MVSEANLLLEGGVVPPKRDLTSNFIEIKEFNESLQITNRGKMPLPHVLWPLAKAI